MYVTRWRLFIGIGLVFLPLEALIAAQQALVYGASDLVGIQQEGEGAGALAFVVSVIAATLTVAGLGLVQGATTHALLEIDHKRPIDAIRAYRLALRRLGPLLVAVAAATAAVILLSASLALIPLAIWLTGRWALTAQAVEVEKTAAVGALRRSSELVRGRWFRVASLIVVGAAIAIVLGPLVGALLIVVTDAPFWVLNLAAGLVYAITMPLVALTTAYVYFDAIVRERLEPRTALEELPSELDD
jgi:hypothetical protein